MNLIVPPSALHVHAIDEATVLRRLSDGAGSGVIHDLEVEAELVDRNFVFTCVVLKRAREERLREEEA